MRILAPSIVDPDRHRGGAGAVTRALTRVLARSPVRASVEFVSNHSTRSLPHGSFHRRCFHRVWQTASLARSLGSPLPAKAQFTRSRRLLREVARRLADTRVDLLMLCGSDLVWLLDELPRRPPTLLLSFNYEHDLFRSQIARLRAPAVLRAALLRDCEKLRRYEERGMRQAAHVIFVSQDDARRFEREHPGAAVLHVPPLFDYAPYERRPRGSGRPGLDLGFLGNLEWWPNGDGLRWFLRKVLPHTSPDLRLHVFGEGGGRSASPHAQLLVHGFQPRIEDVWRRCDFMICPIASGAGVNVKLAEALYNRMPVLARPFAIRGLGLEPHEALVTLESAAEWIDFLRSPAARALAARCGPGQLVQRFRAETHAQAVQAFVARAARSQGAA